MSALRQTTSPTDRLRALLARLETAAQIFRACSAIRKTEARYPVIRMSAMREALGALQEGRHAPRLLDFAEVRNLVGFPEYSREEARYSTDE